MTFQNFSNTVRIYIQYRWLVQLEYASTDAATMQSSDLSMLVDTVGDSCLLTSLQTNILTKYVSMSKGGKYIPNSDIQVVYIYMIQVWQATPM